MPHQSQSADLTQSVGRQQVVVTNFFSSVDIGNVNGNDRHRNRFDTVIIEVEEGKLRIEKSAVSMELTQAHYPAATESK